MGLYYIKKADKFKKKSGEDYYSGRVLAEGKEFSYKIWDITCNLKAGDFISADAKKDSYNGTDYFVFSNYKKEDLKEEDKMRIAGVKVVDVDFFYKEIKRYAEEFCGRYKGIVMNILGDLENSLKSSYCAESVHHDYKGGLIEHTYEVMRLCFSITEIYENIDVALLISGAILHDIGKIFTYEEKGDFVAGKTYTGEFEEHLYIGAEKVNEYKSHVENKLDLSLLKHMILSHHGKREWGSPVIPKNKEADILHQCDMISSRLTIYDKKIEECNNDEMFTEKDYFLGTKVYKGGVNER